MNTNFTNKIRNSWPPGLLRPQIARFSAVGLCQAGDSIPSRLVSRRRRCSRAMVHRVTVQQLTEKRKIPWRLLKIENQLLPPIPWPFPPRSAGGRGTFFCGFLQAGYARLQKLLFFLPLPNGACAVGEGAGGISVNLIHIDK